MAIPIWFPVTNVEHAVAHTCSTRNPQRWPVRSSVYQWPTSAPSESYPQKRNVLRLGRRSVHFPIATEGIQGSLKVTSPLSLILTPRFRLSVLQYFYYYFC